MLPKLKILFLCTGNSCCCQMAEGWTRLADGTSSEEAALELYRRVRDEIRLFVETLPRRLAQAQSEGST
jgi:protein-tyrosine-phosphatase